MRHELGSRTEPGVRFERETGVLDPSVPQDIGAQARRWRILCAMADACAEKSFAKTTIADIVSRASISRATFYKLFRNKRECFDEAVEAFVEELEETAAEARADAEPGLDTLERVVAAVLDLLAARPSHAKLLLIEAPTVDPSVIGRYRSMVLGALRGQWGSGRGDGEPPGADPSIAFGRAQVLLADHVAAGRADRLPALLPEVMYVALLPFVGQEEALGHAKLGR
jgi:AcrR family transcriptional regulator